MAVWNEKFGQVRITFDGTSNGASEKVIIDKTDREEDSILNVETSTFGVEADQISGYIYGNHYLDVDNCTFVCYGLIQKEDLPNLTNAYIQHSTLDSIGYRPNCAKLLYGDLLIHPLCLGENDTSNDIIATRATCTVTLEGNMKVDDKFNIMLTFHLHGDDDPDSDVYGMPFTIGSFYTPPEILTDLPPTQTLIQDDILSFNIILASGGDDFTSVEWYKNDVLIADTNSLTYTVTNADISDSGNYYAIVKNGNESVQSQTSVATVNYSTPIIITDIPANITQNVGEDLTLSMVLSTGNDRFTSVQWYKDTVLIDTTVSLDYTIPNAQIADSGTYNAIIINGSEMTTSGDSIVAIEYIIPVILNDLPATEALLVGDDLVLEVTLDPSGQYFTSVEYYKDAVLFDTTTELSTTIPNVQLADAGDYYIKVINGTEQVNSTTNTVTIT